MSVVKRVKLVLSAYLGLEAEGTGSKLRSAGTCCVVGRCDDATWKKLVYSVSSPEQYQLLKHTHSLHVTKIEAS